MVIKENINSGMGYITFGNKIEIHPLDSFKLENISFIKIDVEGYEYFVLKGALEILKNNKILLMFELNGNESRYNITYDNINELLKSIGVFNSNQMNQAVFAFRRYEDSSLSYTGIDSHPKRRHIGLYDTVVAMDQSSV